MIDSLPEHIQGQIDAVEAISRLSGPRYPNIEVRLSGTDGNAFSIIGKVSRVLRQAGVCADEIKAFREEAMAGDYDALLRACMSWVAVT